jgi:two-component sensor histidine kinase
MVAWGFNRWRTIWPLGLRPRSTAAFGFAILCVLIATGVRIGLGLIRPHTTVYATFYSATLVAALVGGRQAGVLAAIAGGLVGYMFFIPAEWGSNPFTLPHVLSFGLYGASSAVIVWAAESYRSLLRALQAEQTTRQLLNRELAHRVKNTMATVQAVVSQTLRMHEGLRETLSARIAALAATNDLLTQSDWHYASVREILHGELAPYGLSRVQLAGEDVECPPTLAVYLALVFHELTTNAVKYGALSSFEGRIYVSWAQVGDRLELQWIESGGPKPAVPNREGFGTKLLKAGMSSFHGRFATEYGSSGLRCRLWLHIPAGSDRSTMAPDWHDHHQAVSPPIASNAQRSHDFTNEHAARHLTVRSSRN